MAVFYKLTSKIRGGRVLPPPKKKNWGQKHADCRSGYKVDKKMAMELSKF